MKNSDFPLNWHLHWCLESQRGTFYQLVKFTKWQWQNWQCASLLKNCCSLLKKSDFSLNWYLHWYLKGVKKAHFTIGKIDNVSKLTNCASLFPNFCLIKNSDFSPSTVRHQKFRFSTKLCVMKTSDFPLNWYLHFKVVWALSGLLYLGGPTARARKEA